MLQAMAKPKHRDRGYAPCGLRREAAAGWIGVSVSKFDEGEEEMNLSTPARRPWTAGERKKLDELKNAGKTVPEIATALQRSPVSVYSQLQRLEIKKAIRRLAELGPKAKK